MWITNPGDNEKTPDPDLGYATLVRVRFRGSPQDTQDSFSDVGEVSDFYWYHDGDLSDIIEYRIFEG